MTSAVTAQWAVVTTQNSAQTQHSLTSPLGNVRLANRVSTHEMAVQ